MSLNGHGVKNIPLSGLGEQVALALQEAILLGKLQPGERIVEAETALQLGTSNGPVRASVARTGRMGLVICIPDGGRS